MSDSPEHTDRRFTDDEMSLILEEAAGRHVHRGGASGQGYSLEEIQQIASEAGIAPAHVAAAAAQVAANRRVVRPAVPRPGVFQLDHAVGVKLSQEAQVDLVDAVRRAAGMPGEVAAELGDTVWTAANETSRWRLVVRARAAGTTVFLERDASDARILTWAGVGIATLFLALFAVLGLRSAGVDRGYALLTGVGLWWTTAAVGGHVLWRRIARRFDERTAALGERITTLMATWAGGPPHERLPLPPEER